MEQYFQAKNYIEATAVRTSVEIYRETLPFTYPKGMTWISQGLYISDGFNPV